MQFGQRIRIHTGIGRQNVAAALKIIAHKFRGGQSDAIHIRSPRNIRRDHQHLARQFFIRLRSIRRGKRGGTKFRRGMDQNRADFLNRNFHADRDIFD